MRCQAKTKNGVQCKNISKVGSRYCGLHRKKRKLKISFSIVLSLISISVGYYSIFIADVHKKINQQEGKLSTSVLLSSSDNIYPKIRFGYHSPVLEDARFAFNFQNRLNFDQTDQAPIGFWFLKNDKLIVENICGQLSVSTTIRNKEGKVIAILNRNEWKINEKTTFDRNYCSDALEVIDNYGEVVLQIVLEGDVVQFQGKFYDNEGYGMAFSEPDKNDGSVASIEFYSPKEANYQGLQTLINPIFKYPSSLHLGELIENP